MEKSLIHSSQEFIEKKPYQTYCGKHKEPFLFYFQLHKDTRRKVKDCMIVCQIIIENQA